MAAPVSCCAGRSADANAPPMLAPILPSGCQDRNLQTDSRPALSALILRWHIGVRLPGRPDVELIDDFHVKPRRVRALMIVEKEVVKRQYGKLVASISEALFKADPAGINFETNTDEYEPEATTIIPRLRTAQSAEDVQNIVYEEFLYWFGGTAGTKDNYAAVAAEIWVLWCAFRSSQSALRE
jgi:hypothetical protein